MLRIAAPGTSVRVSDGACNSSEPFHVLGVNYFSECSDLQLWNARTAFVIEPHQTYKRYIQSIRRAAVGKEECFVIVKGIGSPKKISAAFRLIRGLSRLPNVTVFIANDVYIADLPETGYAEAVVLHGGNIVSGSKTLLWTLSFAFAAGYRTIVLHGFDFSDAYAYGQTAPATSERLGANTWVQDAKVRDATLVEVARLVELFQERGVKLMQCGCDGPLKTLLQADPSFNL